MLSILKLSWILIPKQVSYKIIFKLSLTSGLHASNIQKVKIIFKTLVLSMGQILSLGWSEKNIKSLISKYLQICTISEMSITMDLILIDMRW